MPIVTAASVASQICLQTYLLWRFTEDGLLDLLLLANSQYIFITTIIAGFASFVLLPFLSKSVVETDTSSVFTGVLLYIISFIVAISCISFGLAHLVVDGLMDYSTDFWFLYEVFLVATIFKAINLLLSSARVVHDKKYFLVLYTLLENSSILVILVIGDTLLSPTKLLAVSYLFVLVSYSIVLIINAVRNGFVAKPDLVKSRNLVFKASWNLVSTASSRGLILTDRFILSQMETVGSIAIFNYIIQMLKSSIAVFGSKLGIKSLLIDSGTMSDDLKINRLMEIRRLAIKAITAYLFALLCVFTFADLLASFDLPIKLEQVKGILAVLFAYFVFGSLNAPVTGMLYHLGEIKWMTKTTITLNVFSLFIKLILFKYLGLLGLAVSYVLSSTAVFFVMNFRLNRMINFRLNSFLKAQLSVLYIGFIVAIVMFYQLGLI